MNKAVFIDRDGTINRDVPYCSCPQDFKLLPKVAEGINLLCRHDYKIVVITNQSGIARGYFSEDTLDKIHQKMKDELAGYGAKIDGIYYCPHHPDDRCACRKPSPELILQAASDLAIDLVQSYVIGDRDIDIDAGKRAGCRTILVGSPSISLDNGLVPDTIVSGVLEAAKVILRREELTEQVGR